MPFCAKMGHLLECSNGSDPIPPPLANCIVRLGAASAGGRDSRISECWFGKTPGTLVRSDRSLAAGSRGWGFIPQLEAATTRFTATVLDRYRTDPRPARRSFPPRPRRCPQTPSRFARASTESAAGHPLRCRSRRAALGDAGITPAFGAQGGPTTPPGRNKLHHNYPRPMIAASAIETTAMPCCRERSLALRVQQWQFSSLDPCG